MVEAYFCNVWHTIVDVLANIDAIFEACVQDKTEGASFEGI